MVSGDLQVLAQLQAPAVLLFQMTRQLRVGAYHLIALAAGLLDFTFQAVNMPLAFPEQVRASMNIQKPAQRRGALDRAYSEKKVRISSSTAHAVHARIDRRERSFGIEGEGLDMILHKNGDGGEELSECGLELGELKFVSVKRIGALRSARFGVVQLVGCRDEKNAVWAEHTARFRKQTAPLGQMLDHLEAGDQIEGGIGERQGRGRGRQETKIRLPVMGAAVCDPLDRDVDSNR